MKTITALTKVIFSSLLIFAAVGCSKDKGGNHNPYGYWNNGQYIMSQYGQCVDRYTNQPVPQQYCQGGYNNGQYIMNQYGQCVDRYSGQPVQPQLCQMSGGMGGQCVGNYYHPQYGDVYCMPTTSYGYGYGYGMQNNCSGHTLISRNQWNYGQQQYCM
jgi:hypothetical protein